MRIVLAPDSFKESATSVEVCEALARGWRSIRPEDEIVSIPMADGGEGTVDAMLRAAGGDRVTVAAHDPLGRVRDADYGILDGGRTAVIETAAASGLTLVKQTERNPAAASTFGTGELIVDALDRGVALVIVGLGGSATNDGGAGMASALGYGLLDASDRPLPPGGLALARLARIDASNRHRRLPDVEFRAACDVRNPLCGPEGASRVYGPQKGAGPELVERLDGALRHFAGIVARDLGVPVLDVPGAGAAGGLGAGLLAFTGARLLPGFDVISEACGLDAAMEHADIVITGEGKLDRQSLYGKTPAGVARAAKRSGARVIAVAGMVGDGLDELRAAGIDDVIVLGGADADPRDSIARARELLEAAGADAAARCAAIGPTHGSETH